MAVYEHGSKVALQGQFDYATDMFVQCVCGAPGDPRYIAAYLGNLSKKYNFNKKGHPNAGIKLLAIRATIKRAAFAKKWDEVIKAGLEGLKSNPWDIGILAEMVRACDEMGFVDSRTEYFKQMLDA